MAVKYLSNVVYQIAKVLAGPKTEENVLSERYLCTIIKEKAYGVV
jgi:hypothetical protein